MRAGLLALALALASAGYAQAPEEPRAKRAAKPAASTSKAANRPEWAELTADQQMILAPLKPEWDSLEPERRRKWIGIAKRYPNMTPQAQERVQRRMQDWARLTPEQRRIARENYKRIAKERAEKRERLRQLWAEYQALSPEERARLEPPPPLPGRKKRE